MSPHHEPFKSLGPIDWAHVDPSSDGLSTLLTKTFADAQTLIESIPDLPGSSSSAKTGGGRARAATVDSAGVAPHIVTAKGPAGGDEAVAHKIMKDWKEQKVSAKENPMGIHVWKLSAKDGKGSWFARRSVHKELGFGRWKEGLEREFEQTLGVEADNPDDQLAGKIRGIGAEKRLEDIVVDGVARLQVYQLSVRFPGPTTPRDFVTLLVTSTPELQEDQGKDKPRKPRQMVVISKPVVHPETPERSGFIRGTYESVEVIREIAIGKTLRKTHSSLDMSRDEFARPAPNITSEEVGKEAMLRAAKRADENGDAKNVNLTRQTKSDVGQQNQEEDDTEYAIEWLMVTRSDPGGSVPRFMVEKGTPPGICTDAGRFVKWLFSDDFSAPAPGGKPDSDAKETTDAMTDEKDTAGVKPKKFPTQTDRKLEPVIEVETPGIEHRGEPTSGGFYSMISNAVGAAGSLVASALPAALTSSSAPVSDTSSINSEESDTTSSDAASFASAEDGDAATTTTTTTHTHSAALPIAQTTTSPSSQTATAAATSSSRSVRSLAVSEAGSETGTLSVSTTRHDKELRKLEDRRRRAEEKWAKMQERAAAASPDDQTAKSAKEEAALAKLKEKHEKELAKQEEKYKKEVRKLEEKRVAEEKKAEEKRRKQIEKEAKENIVAELDRCRAERDLALKQIDILKDQVGELQTQNTMLVAKLGKVGERVDDVAAVAAASD